MSEARRRGGQPGNKGGRPSERPKGDPIVIRPYRDQEDWIEEQGGKDYILRLVDRHRADPVPLYPPEDLIV